MRLISTTRSPLSQVILGGLLLALQSTAPLNAAEGHKGKPETLLSVAISQIALMTLSAHVAAYGVVEPAPANLDQPPATASLTTQFPGIVNSILVTEGQQIEKGETLLRVKRPSSSSASESPEWSVAAPFSGVITRINVRPGQIAELNASLAEMFDPSRLVATGTVPAEDASNLKLGRPVEISTNLANSKVLGTLLYVSPVVDEITGGVAVRASLPGNSGWRPGQFVKLRIATEEHANILAVPVESLVKDPDVGYVVALVEGDIATQKPVRVGIRDGDFVEVEGEGVKVGQTVAAEGAYSLPKQSKVHVITPVD